MEGQVLFTKIWHFQWLNDVNERSKSTGGKARRVRSAFFASESGTGGGSLAPARRRRADRPTAKTEIPIFNIHSQYNFNKEL
jgi:hypothetical protein